VLITIEKARALLGREASKLTDEQVGQMCRELEDYSRMLLNYYDRLRASQPAPAPAAEERQPEVAPTSKSRRS
jgi:hypothetical protein